MCIFCSLHDVAPVVIQSMPLVGAVLHELEHDIRARWDIGIGYNSDVHRIQQTKHMGGN